MSRHSLLLTPNHRLSASLKRQAADTFGDETAWVALEIQPLQAWLESLWCQLETRGLVTERLLQPIQEELIWEQVIHESSASDLLLRVSATAKEAMKAFQLIEAWQVEVTQNDFTWTQDSEAFYEWHQNFIDKLHAKGLVSNSQLLKKLCSYNVAKYVSLPDEIQLYGFIEKQPSLNRFFDYLTEVGVKVQEKKETRPHQQSLYYHECADFEHELNAAVTWAKEVYEHQPKSKIALVVNNLEDVRAEVERVFIEVFEPDVLLDMHPPKRESFNISAGIALSQSPIIDAALQVLMLQRAIIPTNQFSTLLRSPFFSWNHAVNSQAYELDFLIRKTGNRHWPLNQLMQFLTKAEIAFAEKNRLIAFIKELKQQQKKKEKQMLPSDWVKHWASLLTQIGWPGERALSSEEFQAREAWQSLLLRFGQADEIIGSISQADAFQQLLKQTGREVFQPQTPYARIQVLGPLEAASIHFDALWFLGLDDLQWPSAPKPTPFIPLPLQKKHAVPQSSPERECAYANTLLNKIIPFSKEVVLSWARQQDDKSITASPLIQSLLLRKFQPGNQKIFNLATELLTQGQTELHEDGRASPLAKTQLNGGASLLKSQAACPFQAYARYRLNAMPIPPLNTGVTAMERGSILHSALESFWNVTKNLKNLLSMPNEDRRLGLKQSLELAIERELEGRIICNPEVWFKVELDTCVDILMEWLSVECSRPDFEVVATELADEVQVGPLTLKVRLDRVDRLSETNALLLIDYKSGTPSINDWFGDRPAEPQMPLYAVSRKQVKALAYGYVKKGATQLMGLSEEEGTENGVSAIKEYSSGLLSWESALQEWKQSLDNLAESFCAGEAEVNPKNQAVCNYCELSTLCRINEKVTLDDKAT